MYEFELLRVYDVVVNTDSPRKSPPRALETPCITATGFCNLLHGNDLMALRLAVVRLDLQRLVDFVTPNVLLPTVLYPLIYSIIDTHLLS